MPRHHIALATSSRFHRQFAGTTEVVMRSLASTFLMVCCYASVGLAAEQDVRVLATAKTSTMEKEMNEAAESGFRFAAVMGGDTAFGGSEVVVVLTRTSDQPRVQYRLLATGKTSTMEKEFNRQPTPASSIAARPCSRARSAEKRLRSFSSATSRPHPRATATTCSPRTRHRQWRKSFGTQQPQDTNSWE